MQDFDAVRAKFFEPVGTDMPDTGLYRPSTTELALAIGGVKVASFVSGAGGASPRLVHTGNTPVKASTDGNDTTPATTETYIAEVAINAPMLVTGVAVFNGSVASGNIKVGLFNSAGTLVASSASTAMSGTDAFQRVAFSSTYQAAPGRYYVGLQVDNTTARINTHPIGNFGASKKTGEVYGTFTTITPPTTFTANQGPMGGLY
jgi:hypothetical protein